MTTRASLSLIVAASFLSVLSVCVGSAHASDTNGTIITDSQYAWGENMGWVNFAPQTGGTYEGLVVTDSAVTGYAWSSQFGWINFSPVNSGQGVTNTPTGQLGGSAWVAGLGWLPMDGVTIGNDGVFAGVAGTQGSNVGRVSFDCANCRVATDWRPASTRTQPTPPSSPRPSSGGAGSPPPVVIATTSPATSTPSFLNPQTPPPSGQTGQIHPGDKPVTVSGANGGTVTVTSADGKKVSLIIPPGTFSSDVIITITPELLTPTTSPATHVSALLIGGTIFNIIAKDQNGNLVHNFGKTISITIDLPKDLKDTTDLNVYYLDESHADALHWVRIPDAVIAHGTLTLHVNHLTRFGIFKASGSPDSLPVSAPQAPTKPYIIFLLLIVIWYVYTTRTRRDAMM